MSENKKKMKDKKPVRKSNSPAPSNGLRNFTRGPLFWIVLGILAVTFFGQISSASNRYTEVTTSQILDESQKVMPLQQQWLIKIRSLRWS